MTVPVKWATHEPGTFGEWSGGSQTGGTGSVIEISTTRAYRGNRSMRAFITDADGYARALHNDVSVVQGDDVWFGCAVYLPSGFYTAQQVQHDLVRWDDFPSGNQMGITIPSGSQLITLDRIVPSGIDLCTGPQLDEGVWNFVEARCTMHGTDGSAVNELWVNGVQEATGTGANMPSGGTTYTRLRAGLVSSGLTQTNDIELWMDEVYIDRERKGPGHGAASEPRDGARLHSAWLRGR